MTRWASFIKPWLGYIWAVTAILVAVAILVNQPKLAEVFIIKPGFQVTDNWRGGRIAAVKMHPGYRTILHQPVFEGLWGETRHGFIRIDWTSERTLPLIIVEAVDYDHDGRIDFTIRLNTSHNTVDFHSYHGRDFMLADERVLMFGRSRSIRIHIKKRQ